MAALFSSPDPVPISARPSIYRYAGAFFFVGAAITAAFLLSPIAGPGTYGILLILGAALAAWYGGVAPSSVATIAGALGAWYLVLHPARAVEASTTSHSALLLIAVLAALVVMLLSASYRSQLDAASRDLVGARTDAEQARFNESHLRLANERGEQAREQLGQDLAEARTQLQTGEERMLVAQESARFCLFDWQHASDSIRIVGDPQLVFGPGATCCTDLESLLAVVDERDRERVAEALTSALRDKRAIDVEFRVGSDGATRWVASKGSTVHDLFGHPMRTIGILQDITVKKETERALIRNEKLGAASRLAASIAHEVNNPLAAATNLLYIIKDDPSLSRAGRQYAAMAEEELRRLGNITKQALGFYRENADPVEVNLTQLLDEIIAFYSRNMPSGVTLEKQYESAPPVLANKGELRQVFSNLINNAIQALGESGTIKVSLEATTAPRRDGVLITVEDNGPGISPEHLQAIFEPFFTTKKERGTGLGLWLAKRLVEDHEGAIHVSSNTSESQHGTRFEVFLPAAVHEHITPVSAATADSALP